MMDFKWGRTESLPAAALSIACVLILSFGVPCLPQSDSAPTTHSYFLDCSTPTEGDGSSAHPWNTLAAAQAHPFQPGDLIALRRGTVCHGSFAPRGSGTKEAPIRLTAY